MKEIFFIGFLIFCIYFFYKTSIFLKKAVDNFFLEDKEIPTIKKRAKSVGSKGYIWRTVGDSDVRESHAKMEGVYVDWDNPPTIDGIKGHPSERRLIDKCRCFEDPVLPEI